MTRKSNYLGEQQARRGRWPRNPFDIFTGLRGGRRMRRPKNPKGPVVKENYHTVWMAVGNGRVIKRHKRKHLRTAPGYGTYAARSKTA